MRAVGTDYPNEHQLPTLEDAKRQYVELYGSALVLNTYLKIALLCISLVAVGLVLLNLRTQRRVESYKPLVIRIDDVGRAQAVTYDALAYKPVGQAPELKYFLIQFVTKHYGRIRATLKQQYAEQDEKAAADQRRLAAFLGKRARIGQVLQHFIAGHGIVSSSSSSRRELCTTK